MTLISLMVALTPSCLQRWMKREWDAAADGAPRARVDRLIYRLQDVLDTPLTEQVRPASPRRGQWRQCD
jgi:hypothetical protein